MVETKEISSPSDEWAPKSASYNRMSRSVVSEEPAIPAALSFSETGILGGSKGSNGTRK